MIVAVIDKAVKGVHFGNPHDRKDRSMRWLAIYGGKLHKRFRTRDLARLAIKQQKET